MSPIHRSFKKKQLFPLGFCWFSEKGSLEGMWKRPLEDWVEGGVRQFPSRLTASPHPGRPGAEPRPVFGGLLAGGGQRCPAPDLSPGGHGLLELALQRPGRTKTQDRHRRQFEAGGPIGGDSKFVDPTNSFL